MSFGESLDYGLLRLAINHGALQGESGCIRVKHWVCVHSQRNKGSFFHLPQQTADLPQPFLGLADHADTASTVMLEVTALAAL